MPTTPVVPRDAVMPETLQVVLIVSIGILSVLAVAWLLTDARRRRDILPVYILLGGIVAVMYEPLGDIMVLAFYPEVDQHTWISMFGRDVPVFIGLTYLWFMCPFILAFSKLADAGFTKRTWWTLWGWALAGATAFEIIPLLFGDPWIYYGDQALVVLKVPLHVGFVNVTFLFVMAAGVYGLRRALPAARQWLVIPAITVLLTAGHAAAALPAAAALYTTQSSGWILLGALGSIAVAVLVAWTLAQVFIREPATGGGAVRAAGEGEAVVPHEDGHEVAGVA